MIHGMIGERTTADREVFDRAAALDGLGGDEDFLAEVVESFREEAPAWLAALDQTIARGDSTAFRRLGHTIRGASSTLCAAEVERAAHAIEMSPGSDFPEIASGLARDLREALGRFDSRF